MHADRLLADVELSRQLTVRPPLGEQCQHLGLPSGQRSRPNAGFAPPSSSSSGFAPKLTRDLTGKLNLLVRVRHPAGGPERGRQPHSRPGLLERDTRTRRRPQSAATSPRVPPAWADRCPPASAAAPTPLPAEPARPTPRPRARAQAASPSPPWRAPRPRGPRPAGDQLGRSTRLDHRPLRENLQPDRREPDPRHVPLGLPHVRAQCRDIREQLLRLGDLAQGSVRVDGRAATARMGIITSVVHHLRIRSRSSATDVSPRPPRTVSPTDPSPASAAAGVIESDRAVAAA